MLCMSTVTFAQEKYEQAIALESGRVLVVSIEGKEPQQESIKPSIDFKPLLAKLAELRNEGWEVWNSSGLSDNGFGIIYFLRRKIK